MLVYVVIRVVFKSVLKQSSLEYHGPSRISPSRVYVWSSYICLNNKAVTKRTAVMLILEALYLDPHQALTSDRRLASERTTVQTLSGLGKRGIFNMVATVREEESYYGSSVMTYTTNINAKRHQLYF